LTTGAAILGSKIPIMCGAMGWFSDPKPVTAAGNAGGFGLLAGGRDR
jgi:enoyl-[acyl-carrier protein] reductase II